MVYRHMRWGTSQKILYLRKVNDRLKSGMMYKTRLLVSVEAAESFYSLGWPLRLFCSLFLWGSVLLSPPVLEIMMTFIPTRQRELSQIVFLLAQLEHCMQLGQLKNRLTIYTSKNKVVLLPCLDLEGGGRVMKKVAQKTICLNLLNPPMYHPDVCQQRICIRITWAMNEKYLEVKYCHENLRQFFQRIGKVYPKVSSFLSVNFASSSLDIFQRE